MEHIKTIDDIDVHIEGEGTETIVMIHGWPDTYRLWNAQVECFKSRYRCIRFTLPGFDCEKPARPISIGDTVALFKRIIEATAPNQKVILMLHDWGCVFGYEFYMQHPELVSKIIGVDIGDAGSPHYLASLGARAKGMILGYQLWLAAAWILRGPIGNGMTRFMARALKVPTSPQWMSARMNYPYLIQWTGAYGSYRHLTPFAPQCPMLFIYGEKKPFLFHTPAWAQALAAQDGCAVKAFDTGHWVMTQSPQAFNDAVLNWLVSG